MVSKWQGLGKKYELYGCIQCGTCTAGCPVSVKSGLSIRKLIRRGTLNEDLTFEKDSIWACTTCSACQVRCPRDLEPLEVLTEIRSTLVEGGIVPPQIRDALENIFKHGNPWGQTRGKRSEWVGDLDVKNISEGAEAGLLYFVGCAASYDNRCQDLARALVRTFNKAGVDLGILGNKENCCGNEVCGMGEKGLFETLKDDNLSVFDRYGVMEAVTTSPHCYNAFKNKYPEKKFEVRHYTQYLSNLIGKGKLTFTKRFEKRVSFHDPCFLGKHNDVYEEPRFIIESIPGTEYIELDRAKHRSLCCEGGGGRMWLDIPGERSAEIRVEDAVNVGAEVLLTACPFCLLTLEDAAKSSGREERIQVMDIIELVASSI